MSSGRKFLNFQSSGEPTAATATRVRRSRRNVVGGRRFGRHAVASPTNRDAWSHDVFGDRRFPLRFCSMARRRRDAYRRSRGRDTMVGVSAVDRLRALGRTPRHFRKARQWTNDRARLPPNNGARACVRACVPACVAGAVLSSNRTLRSVAAMHRHTSSCAVALALFRILLSVAHLLTLSLSLFCRFPFLPRVPFRTPRFSLRSLP